MQTQCLNCGLLLTSPRGKRIESAYFDSRLPALRVAEPSPITWARCERCYGVALRRIDPERSAELGRANRRSSINTRTVTDKEKS